MAPKVKAPDPAADVLSKLKDIYGFMTKNNLDTVEIEEPGLKLRMARRQAPAPALVPVALVGSPCERGESPPPPSRDAAAWPAASGAPGPLPQGAAAVKSSMMGIFYRAPSASSPPFTKEGDIVKPGQVLCIIEAMKVFNELKTDFAGTVLKVLAENGKPVKAGQDVFWIQRA